MKHDLISIVSVVYNAAGSLERTIQSVIKQTYNHYEYIIIDGGSTDNTINIINKYARYIKYWVSEKDKGIYDAMNKGTIQCSGQWIIYLNAGDEFYDQNVLDNIFKQDYTKNTGCIFGDSYIIDEIGDMHLDEVNPFWLQHKAIKHKGICHQACFIRKEVALRFPYDTKYKISADFQLLVDIKKNNYSFYYRKTPICIFETGGTSAQSYSLALKEDILISKTKCSPKDTISIWIKQQKKTIASIVRRFAIFLYHRNIKYLYLKIQRKKLKSVHETINEGYL